MPALEIGPLLTRIVIERRELADGSDVVVGATAEDAGSENLPELITVLGMLELAKDSLMTEYMDEN